MSTSGFYDYFDLTLALTVYIKESDSNVQHLLSSDNTTCISQLKIATERRITRLELEFRLFKSTVKNCPLQDI